MLTVISPAKRLDETPRPSDGPPGFADDTALLLDVLRERSADDLAALMDLSPKLAALNAARFRDWDRAATLPAVRAFAGDTYAGLDAATLDADALRWGAGRLRILSGLYGLLRPMDGIRPYRLEMGTRLATDRGRDLYAFWGTRLAAALDREAEAAGSRWLLNCASVEYFRAVDPDALRLPVVAPVFLEDRPNGPKVVSFAAKRARGAMARFVLEHRIEAPGDLRAFASGGYRWQSDGSTPGRPVFLRDARSAAA